jgi:hypothetical protein
MKRCNFFVLSCVFIVFFLVSICTSAHSQEWHVANQATITWDAVAVLSDGSAIPTDNLVEYRVWLVNADTDPDKANPVRVGTTSETLYVVTLNVEGRFFVGLQTLRKSSDGTLLGESGIGWTDDPEIAADGIIFGLQYFLQPANTRGVGLLNN